MRPWLIALGACVVGCLQSARKCFLIRQWRETSSVVAEMASTEHRVSASCRAISETLLLACDMKQVLSQAAFLQLQAEHRAQVVFCQKFGSRWTFESHHDSCLNPFRPYKWFELQVFSKSCSGSPASAGGSRAPEASWRCGESGNKMDCAQKYISFISLPTTIVYQNQMSSSMYRHRQRWRGIMEIW
jgi:hypothetical protein